MVLDDARLSRKARFQIESSNRVAYSIASFWEIGLKLSRGGFEFELPLAWHEEMTTELREIGLSQIEIKPTHCRRLQDLPWHHKDPFDRMLLAQAQVEELAILTADTRFKSYGVRIVWYGRPANRR